MNYNSIHKILNTGYEIPIEELVAKAWKLSDAPTIYLVTEGFNHYLAGFDSPESSTIGFSLAPLPGPHRSKPATVLQQLDRTKYLLISNRQRSDQIYARSTFVTHVTQAAGRAKQKSGYLLTGTHEDLRDVARVLCRQKPFLNTQVLSCHNTIRGKLGLAPLNLLNYSETGDEMFDPFEL